MHDAGKISYSVDRSVSSIRLSFFDTYENKMQFFCLCRGLHFFIYDKNGHGEVGL